MLLNLVLRETINLFSSISEIFAIINAHVSKDRMVYIGYVVDGNPNDRNNVINFFDEDRVVYVGYVLHGNFNAWNNTTNRFDTFTKFR